MPEGFSWSELGVDSARVRPINELPLPTGKRDFVLYWCMVNQRAVQNHALEVALALGNHLGLPVVCYQALRPDYPHASDRIHAFVLEGLDELGEALRKRGVPYWLELPHDPRAHQPRFGDFTRRAAAVVSDLFPAFIIPGHLRGACRALTVPLFAVDASCVVPMQRIAEKQIGAYTLRPKLKKLWPEYLEQRPEALPAKHARAAEKIDLGFEPVRSADEERKHLQRFQLDHSVPPAQRRGGRKEALRVLRHFIEKGLPRFAEERNAPGELVASNLSPSWHFGSLFAGEAAHAALAAHGPTHPGVASFLDELLVRRELGFNYCLHTPQKQQLAITSLPRWAQETLHAHEKDARAEIYSMEQLELGRTGDPLWNAAQRQLREEGFIHNYLRMLWGKKILEWSPTPKAALQRIAHLNDKYALDGRDPVSVANFMWILGLHDRPFQERKVLGKVRPMSSFRTTFKSDLTPYLARFGGNVKTNRALREALK